MLKPLEQFICDSCHKPILSKADGWIEWRTKETTPLKYYGFSIVHHITKSPIKNERGCYKYCDVNDCQSLHLNHFVDENAIYNLINMVDVGPDFRDSYSGPQLLDLREWAELTKRLLLPYYEEARLYIPEALGDEFLDDPGNPHYLYSTAVLKRIVEKYSPHH